jgi:hypothetical protein
MILTENANSGCGVCLKRKSQSLEKFDPDGIDYFDISITPIEWWSQAALVHIHSMTLLPTDGLAMTTIIVRFREPDVIWLPLLSTIGGRKRTRSVIYSVSY